MKIKPTLIKLHSIIAGQFGIDPRIFIRSLFGLPIYLRDWVAFRMDYAGSMKFTPCLHDRYEEGGTTKSEYRARASTKAVLIADPIREQE